MFILDTDAITHDQNGHPILTAKVRSTPLDRLFTTSLALFAILILDELFELF